MVHYLWRRRSQLSSMIDDIWQWECIDETVAVTRRSRLEALLMAAKTPCICGSKWVSFVAASAAANGIDLQDLCKDVYNAFKDGRSETTPVIALA